MGFFDKLKSNVTKMNRNVDLLEGGAAFIALVAAADGTISDAEEKVAKKRATTSKVLLGAGFTTREIEQMIDKMLDKADGGSRSGRRELYKELEDVKDKDEDGSLGEAILILALDVADEGGIDPKEEAVLREGAVRLGQDYDKVAAL
jgi:tellurite resistance protein TerB